MGKTIGPQFRPAEVTLDLVQSQRAAVCTDPLWIPSTTLCGTLADSLAAAHDRFGINNWFGGMAAIDSVASIVLASAADSIESPARWMLYRNARQVVANTLAQSPGAGTVRLCAEGPSATTASFTIAATQPSVLSSPHQVVAEVHGVDPPGSSCEEVWRMGLGVTQLADVTVTLDSVSAGASFDRFEATGAVTIVSHGSDWVTTRHDGETAVTVWYYFVASEQE